MKISSAEEDFKVNTLGKMSGCLTKAEYVAGLLNESGCLTHWGMERTHGVESAQTAMKNAFEEQMQAMLRSSLRELWEEAEKVCSRVEAKDLLLSRMREAIESKGGKELNEVQLSHLKAVLDSLLEVALHAHPNQDA